MTCLEQLYLHWCWLSSSGKFFKYTHSYNFFLLVQLMVPLYFYRVWNNVARQLWRVADWYSPSGKNIQSEWFIISLQMHTSLWCTSRVTVSCVCRCFLQYTALAAQHCCRGSFSWQTLLGFMIAAPPWLSIFLDTTVSCCDTHWCSLMIASCCCSPYSATGSQLIVFFYFSLYQSCKIMLKHLCTCPSMEQDT